MYEEYKNSKNDIFKSINKENKDGNTLGNKIFYYFQIIYYTMSYFMCVLYVCVHMYARAVASSHVCTCLWRPEVNVMHLPLSMFVSYFSLVIKCHGQQNV